MGSGKSLSSELKEGSTTSIAYLQTRIKSALTGAPGSGPSLDGAAVADAELPTSPSMLLPLLFG